MLTLIFSYGFQWWFRLYQHPFILYVPTEPHLQVCEPETKWIPSIPPHLPPHVFSRHRQGFFFLSTAPDWCLKGSFPSVCQAGQATPLPLSIRYRLERPLIIISAHKDIVAHWLLKVATCGLVWMRVENVAIQGTRKVFGEFPHMCSVMRCSCDPAVPGTSISVY